MKLFAKIEEFLTRVQPVSARNSWDKEAVEGQYTKKFSPGSLPEVKGYLIIKEGCSSGERFSLMGANVTIGRKENHELCLADPNISRYHAQLEFQDGSYLIKDLDSLNGVYVNGKKVRRQTLNTGDIIKVGSTVLEFQWLR